ncbi:MAG: hypothetical protein O3A96_09365 [Proteobacteria bacterium]|nr:hypothetical protein [Pseudomonadota bacterium]
MTGAPRYIFTVTAGRSGQASLTHLVAAHVPGALALHEEPQVKPVLPRALGDLERRLRRKFVETHELLGRGDVLRAFAENDREALDTHAARRQAWLARLAARHNAEVVFDVSKYFARGMHCALAARIGDFNLVLLVRDPILNMRSFLNRSKNFYLDNNRPDCPLNELVLDPAHLEPGELYLWAWCEMHLRFTRLVDEFAPAAAVTIRTKELEDAGAMARHFTALGLSHGPIATEPPRNTNAAQGHGPTLVAESDVATFERFRDRLPPPILDRIDYFDGYDPRAHPAEPRPTQAPSTTNRKT